jgi:hypothetical protein
MIAFSLLFSGRARACCLWLLVLVLCFPIDGGMQTAALSAQEPVTPAPSQTVKPLINAIC